MATVEKLKYSEDLNIGHLVNLIIQLTNFKIAGQEFINWTASG